jgi:hypothetical protein
MTNARWCRPSTSADGADSPSAPPELEQARVEITELRAAKEAAEGQLASALTEIVEYKVSRSRTASGRGLRGRRVRGERPRLFARPGGGQRARTRGAVGMGNASGSPT